jgi:hypothetical protein
MLQVLIVCKTLLLIVCRWCATVDRRNVAAFVRLLLAASERSLVPASQGSLVIICRTLFLIVCRCCATVAAAALRRLAVDISRHCSLFENIYCARCAASRRLLVASQTFHCQTTFTDERWDDLSQRDGHETG